MKKLKHHPKRHQRHRQTETPDNNRAAADAWEARIELLAMQLCPIEEWARYEANLQLLAPKPQASPSSQVLPFAPRPAKLYTGSPRCTGTKQQNQIQASRTNDAKPSQWGISVKSQGRSPIIQSATIRLFPVWRKYRQQAKRVATLHLALPMLRRLPLTVCGWLGNLLFK